MPILSGNRQRIVWVREATWGTDPNSGYRSIGQLQGEPTVTIDNQQVSVFAGGRINSRAILDGALISGARFDYYMQDAWLAIASIGSTDTTSPVTNTNNYIHYGCSEDSTSTETTPVEYEVEPYTLHLGIEAGVTDNRILLKGCKTNSITFSINLEEPLRASVECFSKTVTTDTTNADTVTEITEAPYMYHKKGTLTYDGGAITNVTELTCTVNNNLKRSHGISSTREINALGQGSREITGTITLNYDATDAQIADLLGGAAAGDSVNFNTTLLLDNKETVTASTYRGLYFALKNMKLGSLERRFPTNGDFISETYNFTARAIDLKGYDATNSDLW